MDKPPVIEPKVDKPMADKPMASGPAELFNRLDDYTASNAAAGTPNTALYSLANVSTATNPLTGSATGAHAAGSVIPVAQSTNSPRNGWLSAAKANPTFVSFHFEQTSSAPSDEDLPNPLNSPRRK